MPRFASADLARIVRWLPDLVPRSPALVRVASFTAGPSATALDGRPDRIDADPGFGRAVEDLARLRRLISAGHGDDVAALWCAHAALDVRFDEHGVADLGPRHRARQQEAVALGAAPSHARRAWRVAAEERRRVAAYVSEQEVVTQWGREATHDAPALPTLTRTVVHRHLEQSGADGPSVVTSAERWGTELLSVIWSPAPVPPALARALAIGFAPSETRMAWEALRSPALREAQMRSWGEGRLADAEARWSA